MTYYFRNLFFSILRGGFARSRLLSQLIRAFVDCKALNWRKMCYINKARAESRYEGAHEGHWLVISEDKQRTATSQEERLFTDAAKPETRDARGLNALPHVPGI